MGPRRPRRFGISMSVDVRGDRCLQRLDQWVGHSFTRRHHGRLAQRGRGCLDEACIESVSPHIPQSGASRGPMKGRSAPPSRAFSTCKWTRCSPRRWCGLRRGFTRLRMTGPRRNDGAPFGGLRNPALVSTIARESPTHRQDSMSRTAAAGYMSEALLPLPHPGGPTISL